MFAHILTQFSWPVQLRPGLSILSFVHARLRSVLPILSIWTGSSLEPRSIGAKAAGHRGPSATDHRCPTGIEFDDGVRGTVKKRAAHTGLVL